MNTLPKDTIDSVIVCYRLRAYDACLGHICAAAEPKNSLRWVELEPKIDRLLDEINEFTRKNNYSGKLRGLDRFDLLHNPALVLEQVAADPALAHFKPQGELLSAYIQATKDKYKFAIIDSADPSNIQTVYHKTIKSACNHVLILFGLKAQAQAALKEEKAQEAAQKGQGRGKGD